MGLIAVLGIGAVVLAGGDIGILPGGGDAPPAPKFAFRVTKPTVVTTAQINPEATVNEARAKAAAKPAADQVAATLHDLYVAAFLEPANWTEANYESLDAFFAGPARAAATEQAKVLTAGDGVTGLDSILPLGSTLKMRVLLDPSGKPASVAGVVNFQAKGTGGGSVYLFQSKGQYLFRKVEGEWKVVSFSVRRADTERAPVSSSATPTAEET